MKPQTDTTTPFIRAGIVGGAGYAGGEMIRLLLHHPFVELSFVHSRSQAGKALHAVHGDLIGETDLQFTDSPDWGVDLLFCCLGHGESRTFLQSFSLPEKLVLVDLSQDFRLQPQHTLGNRQFVYGMPELNREVIRTANSIANPGCFATALQLALLPLAVNQCLETVHVTGITGATGAGQKLQPSSHFSWRSGNIQAYKSLNHQHLQEIGQSLRSLQPKKATVHFVPWRGDFTRGIHVSAYTRSDLGLEEAYGLYETFYADAPFTHVSRHPVDLKQVVNTNKCLLHLELVDDQLIIHGVLDNLLKGASGQAVQNMNLRFGFPEDAGLRLKANAY